jgi:glycerol-3-phosphate acyltransferase PlsY
LALLISYLIGAIPFALIAGRMRGVDLRAHGSGNLGATNAIRVLGKPLGFTVFLLDFLKGWVPVFLMRVLPDPWIPLSSQVRLSVAFACGMAAVVGHVFPLYLRFKGGKGVAAAAGALMAVQWDGALISFALFFLIRRVSGFVSLASIGLALAFPLALLALHPHHALHEARWVMVGSAALAVLIIFRHRSNLARIMRGEEPKVGRQRKEKEKAR